MYDDFDSDRCYVCGDWDQCNELAHVVYDEEDHIDRCHVCGGYDQCDEFAHSMADEEPYAYDDEPTYNPWLDVRYAFTEAPF